MESAWARLVGNDQSQPWEHCVFIQLPWHCGKSLHTSTLQLHYMLHKTASPCEVHWDHNSLRLDAPVYTSDEIWVTLDSLLTKSHHFLNTHYTHYITVMSVWRRLYHSLMLQIGLVAYEDHGEIVSIFYPQDLSVKLLDLVVAVRERWEQIRAAAHRRKFFPHCSTETTERGLYNTKAPNSLTHSSATDIHVYNEK